jgi:two-component system, NarL family, nitrate/nitrite response regulator NarL
LVVALLEVPCFQHSPWKTLNSTHLYASFFILYIEAWVWERPSGREDFYVTRDRGSEEEAMHRGVTQNQHSSRAHPFPGRAVSARPSVPDARYFSVLPDSTIDEPASIARKVLIVSKRALVQEALAAFIGTAPDLVVAAHCSSLEEALEIATVAHVDCSVFELRVGEERLTEAYKEFRDLCEVTRVLVLLDGVPPSLTNHVIQSNAHAVLPAAVDGSTVLAAIRCISSGKTWINLNTLDAEPRDNGADLHLTYRQMTVLRLIYEGLSNKEISGRIGVSSSSIKATIQQLFKRIGVRSRSQLVREALQCFPDLLLPSSLNLFTRPPLSPGRSRSNREGAAREAGGVVSGTDEGEAAFSAHSSGVR